MTLRSRTSEEIYGGLFKNSIHIARTWETFSERYGYVKNDRKRQKVINVEISVDNEFRIAFEI